MGKLPMAVGSSATVGVRVESCCLVWSDVFKVWNLLGFSEKAEHLLAGGKLRFYFCCKC